MKRFFNSKKNVFFTILAVLGLVGILVLLVVPHGGKYTRTYTETEKKFSASYELKDGKVYSSSMVDGEYLTEDVLLGEYVISGGKISYKVPLTGLSVELGKINAFRFQPNLNEEGTYTCALSIAFFAVACVMTILGVAGIACGIKQKKKKRQKNQVQRKK